MSTSARSSSLCVDPGREHARHGVRADEAGHDRQQADLRVRRGLERKLARGDDDAVAHRGRIGREPHEGHVDAEEDVVHAGVADHHDLVDVLAGHSGDAARVPDEAVDRVQHLGAERDELLLVELRVGDARHEVAAVHGLRVDAADRGQLLPGLQVQERPHDAGGADVERHAVGVLGGVPGLDVDDAAVERGDRELAALLAQLAGDLAQRRDRDAPVDRGVDGRQHLREIGGLAVLLARGARGDDLLYHAGVDREPRAVRGSAVERLRPGRVAAGQDLVPRLRLRRQGHHLAVGDRAGLAAETEALLHLLVAELEGVLHGGRGDVAGEDLAAAAPASAARAARGIHGDARRPGRVEQRGAASDTRARRTAFASSGSTKPTSNSVALRLLHRALLVSSFREPLCRFGCRLGPTRPHTGTPNPGASRSRISGSTGVPPASTQPCRVHCAFGGTPASQGSSSTRHFPGTPQLARLSTPVGLRPTVRVGRPRSQGTAPRCLSRDRGPCPLEHTGGPSAHLRAGRPRSRGCPPARPREDGVRGIQPWPCPHQQEQVGLAQRKSTSTHDLPVALIAFTPTPPAAPPRASSRASPPAPRRGPSRRRRTRRPTPGWSERRRPGSSPCRGARP